MLTATPPASTRSWESVVSLVWRQPEWVARCTVVIDVQQFPFFNLSREKKKKQNKAAFFLPSDSGASMHMITKKGFEFH